MSFRMSLFDVRRVLIGPACCLRSLSQTNRNVMDYLFIGLWQHSASSQSLDTLTSSALINQQTNWAETLLNPEALAARLLSDSSKHSQRIKIVNLPIRFCTEGRVWLLERVLKPEYGSELVGWYYVKLLILQGEFMRFSQFDCRKFVRTETRSARSFLTGKTPLRPNFNLKKPKIPLLKNS